MSSAWFYRKNSKKKIMQQTPYENKWQLGENVLAIRFTDDGSCASIALLDGSALLVNLSNGEEKRVAVHPMGTPLSVCVDGDGKAFLSAGDDGRVVRYGWHEAPVAIAEHKGKWIDHVAASGKLRAYTIGKQVYLTGQEAPLELPSSAGGLAFAPNGKRLAATHYNGVTLWWTSAKESKPQTLPWKGSHLGVCWHPAGDYLITTMQESALHGWRLKDMGELRMAGYPNKVHSFAFSYKGRWLVTSGADQLILWPFTGSGPQGKPPMALGVPEGAPVSVVAPHPKDDMTAAGYNSGRVVLAIFEDRLPIELLPPNGTPVVAMGWSPDGLKLLTAHEDGTLHYFTSQSIINASQAALANPF